MTNSFFSAFNSANAEAERVFGEPWRLLVSATDTHGTEYPAIAVEKLTATSRLALGGKFADVSTTIEVRRAIVDLSGVAKDRLIVVRGETLRVRELDNDGDDSVTLLCGPPGSTMSRR